MKPNDKFNGGREGGASALTQMLDMEVGMALSDRYCGFDEVRRSDEKGYYCECCGKRMDKNFREVVMLTLPHKFIEQLDKQCMPNAEVTGAWAAAFDKPQTVQIDVKPKREMG